MNYRIFIILIFYASSVFGQNALNIKGVNTILKYNENSEFLVILVHGSGKQNMAGSLSFGSRPECFYVEYANREFNLFDEISENLVEIGFSTLRYEKLNVRDKINDDFIIKDFIEDLNHIIQNVQSKPQLKEQKIVLFGWSEGVTVALNQFKYDLDIAGMILFGGVFMDPIIMKADAYYDLYKNCEGNEERAKSYRYQFIHQIEQVGQKNDEKYENRLVFYDTLYNENKSQIIGISKKAFSYSKYYFNDFKTQVENSIARVSNADIPLLIIHGEKDVNVTLENHYFLKKKLKNQKNVSFKTLSNTDHFLRENFNHEINPLFFEMISNWKAKLNWQ
ncbi:alpha/beta hydrolase family protein [Mongoliitalea daihaiensis]|uniref:alpha/beta hydrolase family protein n=1 Tax=Mongoliitalea daihaiensis TaxID=2782006 RepID=UPI001F338F26|nr:alpha/beta hydrolase [Mongoliitalea daihaiensis]UJP65316.1 alpha/beta hydrolase [Mongoliitalea daihaiensis]